MKHLINILVILILTGFVIGIAYLQVKNMDSAWFVAFMPTVVMMFCWGIKLNGDYK